MLVLWTCPKCGVIGRAKHRYDSGLPPAEKPYDDPGPCAVGRQLILFPRKAWVKDGEVKWYHRYQI